MTKKINKAKNIKRKSKFIETVLISIDFESTKKMFIVVETKIIFIVDEHEHRWAEWIDNA